MNYVQFLQGGIEACGSDAVFILDGRNSVDVMKEDARDRAQYLRRVRKYDGFRIYRGQRIMDGNFMVCECKL